MPLGAEKIALLGAAGAGGAGERGVFVGGSVSDVGKNTLQYITIDTAGDATDFGDMLAIQVSSGGSTGNAENDRGIMNGLGGYGGTNYETIEYITISTTGNSVDFGNSFDPGAGKGANSNGTNERAVFQAGGPPGEYGGTPRQDVISYLTINSLGDTADFGDMFQDRTSSTAESNSTNERGVCQGGRWYWPAQTTLNGIEYVTINSTGNGTDFGNMLFGNGNFYSGATSNGTNDRGIWAGAFISPSTTSDTIQYITITSAGDAGDFGNLATAMSMAGCCSSGTSERAVWGGGSQGEGTTNIDVIQYATINSTGDASDFGDILEDNTSMGGISNMCP